MERIGLEPGTEVGGYTVVAPLGAGGMGTVYRAVDGGGTPVALKLLHPAADADAETRARLLREVAALQRLRHPGVAAVLDAEADSSEAFLVTELVDGVDLEETVRRDGPLTPSALAALASGLRDALVAVHAAGVLHRDLKPSNVLVTDHGPVLIDFGLAHGEQDERVTSTGIVVGTPGYLAPEQLDGADPDEAGDWWGWAALLAFAATGRPPFGRGRVATVLARTRAGRPDLVGLPAGLGTALLGALAADPQARSAPDEVVAALGALAADGPDQHRAATEDAGVTALLTGADAVGTAAFATSTATRTVATIPAPRDGHTLAVVVPPAGPPPVPPPLIVPDDDAPDDDLEAEPGGDADPDDPQYTAVELIEDDLDASSGDEGEGSGFVRPIVPRRWVSQIAVALLVLAAGALWPVRTLAVAVAVLLLARAFGLTVEGMYDREERRGVRRADGLVAVVSTPWYVLRAALGLVPALLVAGSVLVIGVGMAWWFIGQGRWTVGDNVPGTALTGTTAALLAGVATLLGVLLVWFGPASRMSRVGTRRLLELVSPGRLGALVLVVLLLVAAAVLGTGALHGAPTIWDPLPAPTVPVPPTPGSGAPTTGA